MSKYVCSCGEIVRDMVTPSEIKYHLVDDVAMDEYYGNKLSLDDVLHDITVNKGDVFECGKCGRLLIFWIGNKRVMRVYKREC